MAVVAAANGRSDQQPAAAVDARRPRATLDPQLLMAARRGDSKALKDLLQLNDARPDGEGSGRTPTTASVAAPSTSQPHVIVQVDPQRPPHDDDAPLPLPLPPPPVPAMEGVHISEETVEQAVVEQPPPDEDGVTMEGDSLLHVVAACGDTQDFLDCAKMIVRNKEKKGGAAAVRLALEARNDRGDTPLHCAARAGNASMIGCLIDDLITSCTTDKKALVRTQNQCGETALHEAVRAITANDKDKKACIHQLMAVDPELACIPCDDDDDDGAASSPLYLAISLGEVEIAQYVYDKSKRGKLSYAGPYGSNVLHAAVHRGQVRRILGWLDDEDMKDMQCPASVNGHMSSSVPRLTSQRDRQQKGSTPLHLAASLNGWPSAWYLSRWFPQVWPTGESMAKLLLDANESTAYQADDEGSYPIHVAAASNSNLGVVKMLVERCPDCATLRDGNGRTFLHVATMEESPLPWADQLHVVQYVCGEMPQQLSSMILNAQDSNGDTALHGAVRAGNLDIFNCLLRNRQVRLDVQNKDGMTPLDVSWATTPPSILDYALNPRNVVCVSLLCSGAPYGGGRPELFCEQNITKVNEDKESQKYTDATQVMSIVSVLISTVTFASAFTLPGGYRSGGGGDDDNHAGSALLAGSYVFDAFILADTLAFICSTLATFSLVYAGVPAMDISIRCYYFNVSVVLLQSAGRSFVAAFALGLYLVLAPVDHTIAVAICVIIFASLLWGNMEASRITCEANTVRARIGMRRFPVWPMVHVMFFKVMVHFGSYMIILGLPAIRKLVDK